MEKLLLEFWIYNKRIDRKIIYAQVVTGGQREEGYAEIYKYIKEKFGAKEEYGFHVYDKRHVDVLTPSGISIIEDLRN